MSKTIAIMNMKGGVGKTTLAVNLSWYFYEIKNKSMLLIDLDPQFNSTQYLMKYNEFREHRTSKGTVADLLIDSQELSLIKKNKKTLSLVDCLYTVDSKVNDIIFDLLPAELNLGYVVKNPSQVEFQLEKMLDKMEKEYDFVIIDCAPTDSVLTTVALNCSDYVLIPIRPDRFAVLGFANYLEVLKQFRKKCPDVHKVKDLGIVFTHVTGDQGVEKECINEVNAEALKEGSHVFGSSLKYSMTYARSVMDQTPAYRTKFARGKPKFNIGAISDEIEARIKQL